MNSATPKTTYAIEVSGWDVHAQFFVERAELRWETNADKFVNLRSEVRGGSLLSVRTILPSGAVGPLLMAYRAERVAEEIFGEDKRFDVRLEPYRRSNSCNAPRNRSLDSFAEVRTT